MSRRLASRLRELANRSPSRGEPQRSDVGILLVLRVIRAVGFGYASVVVGIYLQARGIRPLQIGIVIAVGLAAAAITGLLAANAQSAFGRRRTLAATGVLMFACGSILSFSGNYWLFVLAALTGMLGLAGTDTGPFLSVEQAVLTDATTLVTRNRAFGRYSVTGSLAGAVGAALAVLGSSTARIQLLFVLYAAIGVVATALPLLLSEKIEGEPKSRPFGNLRPLI